MSEETANQLTVKLNELIKEVAKIGAKLEYITDGCARHQSELAILSEAIDTIKLARAGERGWIAGAVAVGGLIGGVLVRILF